MAPTRIGIYAFIATTLLHHAPAMAQETIKQEERNLDDKTARAHFRTGALHYDSGRFEQAASEFVKAFELSRRKELLFNAYVAYRDGGNERKAAWALKQYLAQPGKIDDRANLEARLQTLEARVASLDEQEAKRKELARQATEAEAARKALEEKRKRDREQWEAEQAEARGAGPGPWVLLGTGGAALVGGIVTGIMANSAEADIEDNCPGNLCPTSYDLDGNKGRARSLAVTTDILLFGGAAIAASGAAWYLIHRMGQSKEQKPPPVTGSAGCSSSGCMATVNTRF